MDEDSFNPNIQVDDKEYSLNPNGCSYDKLMHFCKALPKCIPMCLSFFPDLGNHKLCYCPCSKTMDGWRKNKGCCLYN